MNIPNWLINSFAFIGVMFVWTFIAALVGVNLGKFMKENDDENSSN